MKRGYKITTLIMLLMFSISIEGAKAVGKSLGDIPKNVKVAGVIALTKTAQHAQGYVKKSLDEEFVLKNTWTQKGIRIRPAQKTDKEPFSKVYSKDNYIVEHEEGAQRKIGKSMFVPIAAREVLGIPRNKPIPRSYKGSRLKKKAKGYRLYRGKSRSGKPGIFADVAGTPRMLYVERFDPLKIDRHPWFIEVVSKAYNKHFEDEYDKAWDRYVVRSI